MSTIKIQASEQAADLGELSKSLEVFLLVSDHFLLQEKHIHNLTLPFLLFFFFCKNAPQHPT